MSVLPALPTTVLSAAQASSHPAALNGIWLLIGVREAAPRDPAFAPKSAGDLVTANGQLRGIYGCGKLQGALNAAHNTVKIGA